MHQNQWLAAIEELKADGLEETPCPSNWPQAQEHQKFSYQLYNLSEGVEAQQGRWAKGESIDGKGKFEFVADPKPFTNDMPVVPPAAPRVYGTPMARKPADK